MIPEDRRKLGLVFTQNTKSNITITNLEKINNFGLLNKSREIDFVKNLIKEIDIKPNNPEGNISFYSGGNQQKTVISKWLSTKPEVLILDEPTKGIDVRSKSAVHEFMGELVGEGMSIIMISSELPEILGMCDRVVVMYRGKKKKVLDVKDASSEQIVKIASGEE